MVINEIFNQHSSGSSDDSDPKNLGWICMELNKLNTNIQDPRLSNRVLSSSMKIISEKSDAPTGAFKLAAACKLTRAFLNYYRHGPDDSAIHVAIDNHRNNHENTSLSDRLIQDTLSVISKGIDEAIKGGTYDPSTIISTLVRENKLPAQTGGNDQKSKIRNRKWKTRSIKKRRFTRRRSRRSRRRSRQ